MAEPANPAGEQASPPSEFVKHDEGKTRYDVLPHQVIREFAERMTKGAEKYDDFNWREGASDPETVGRYFSALNRHLWAWASGESLDPDDGGSHLTAVICCAAILRDLELMK